MSYTPRGGDRVRCQEAGLPIVEVGTVQDGQEWAGYYGVIVDPEYRNDEQDDDGYREYKASEMTPL